MSEIVKGIDVADIHVDAPLSNMSVAYMQDQTEYIADKWFPIIPVSQISGVYFKYAAKTFFENPTKSWTPGTLMESGSMDMDTRGTFSCSFRAYEFPMPAHMAAAADSVVQLERAVVEKVARALLIDREAQIAGDFFAGSKGWNDHVGGSTGYTQWNNPTTSDVLGNISTLKLEVKSQSGMTPNTMVVNEQVYETIRLHPDIREVYKYTQPAIMTEDLIARAMGLNSIKVAKAVGVSIAQNGAETYGYLFGKHAWVGYVAPNPGIMTPTAGAIFSYTGMTNGFNIAMERVPDRRTHADYFQGYSCYDDKLIAGKLGSIITGVIA
jgi:hypothetical protein